MPEDVVQETPNAELTIIQRARTFADRTAMQSDEELTTYRELLSASEAVACSLLVDQLDLMESRIAFLIPAGSHYVAAQWGIWRAGGIAVPLCLSAAERELEYTLTDAAVSSVLTTRGMEERIAGLCERLDLPLTCIDDVPKATACQLPQLAPERRAMILYTSGTTSRPKGVVSTHSNIEAQIQSLVEAWHWAKDDRIPLFLPLHHIHGIINILSCALWSGANVDAFERFDMSRILSRVTSGAYTVFMAVPTIYVKLIGTLESLPAGERQSALSGFSSMRLMISGSAALPASVHEHWTELTGQKLLERYGMTEIGMALSNPYKGERRPGAVGMPLPGVEVRLVSEAGKVITAEDEAGEIQVRGPAVFCEYWERPEITSDSFTDGWFRTGDMAVREAGYLRIMGRLSVDIIKSGGYKLSALEIESVLLQHEIINECAVVGLPDATWGEAVAAACVFTSGNSLTIEELREWCRDQLSVYKIPKQLLPVEALPRNAMGKVTKPAVTALFEHESQN